MDGIPFPDLDPKAMIYTYPGTGEDYGMIYYYVDDGQPPFDLEERLSPEARRNLSLGAMRVIPARMLMETIQKLIFAPVF